jgi:hypothetical protein
MLQRLRLKCRSLGSKSAAETRIDGAHSTRCDVVQLRLTERLANLDGCQLISADPPIEQLFRTIGGIKSPLTVAFDKRDGQRPFVFSNHQRQSSRTCGDQAVASLVQRDEMSAVVLILRLITGRSKTGGIRAQDLIERGNVIVSVCGYQRINSLMGGRE